jgi:protein TonB
LVTPPAIPDQIADIVDPPSPVVTHDGIVGVAAVPGAVGGPANSVLTQLIKPREAPAPPPKPEPKREGPREPVRVSSDLQSARLIHQVTPVYPVLARQARISGVVRLEAVIAEDGTIRELRVLSGHPLLAPNARDAVRQWRYRPTLLGGVPVPVFTHIDVHFKLGR